MSKIIGGYEIKPKANLYGATLWGAYLRGVNLRGADLQGADLEDASFHDAITFTVENHENPVTQGL